MSALIRGVLSGTAYGDFQSICLVALLGISLGVSPSNILITILSCRGFKIPFIDDSHLNFHWWFSRQTFVYFLRFSKKHCGVLSEIHPMVPTEKATNISSAIPL